MKAKAVGRNGRTISGRNACKAVKTKIKGVYSYDSNILFWSAIDFGDDNTLIEY